MVIEVIVPILGLCLLGVIAAHWFGFSQTATDGLSSFIFNYAAPLMLIRVFSTATLPDDIPWGLFGSYFIPQYLIFFGTVFVLTQYSTREFSDNVIAGLSGSFSNLVLIGLPVVIATLGETATVPLFLIVAIHPILAFTTATALLEYGLHRRTPLADLPLKVGKSLATNPIIVAMLTGVVMNQTGMSLPGPIDRLAALMQQAVTPCALFAVGASLTQYRLGGNLALPLKMILVKNLLFPLSVWFLAARVFSLTPLFAMTLTLMAAQPTGVTTYVVAERYQVARQYIASTIFLSSITAVATLSIVVYLIQRHPQLFSG